MLTQIIFGKCNLAKPLHQLNRNVSSPMKSLLYYHGWEILTCNPFRNYAIHSKQVVDKGEVHNHKNISNHQVTWNSKDLLENIKNFQNMLRKPDGKNNIFGLLPPTSKMSIHTHHVDNNCDSKCSDSGDSDSPGRYNYHEDVENLINEQVTSEFNAAYTYLAMACHFGRTDIGMIGSEKFYMRMAQEEEGHALRMITYQQIRGGTVVLSPISIMDCADGCDIHKSLEVALQKEMMIVENLTKIYQAAVKHGDLRTQDFIMSDFVKEQFQSVRQVAQLLARAKHIGKTGVSHFLFDKEMNEAVAHISEP